MQQFTYKKLLLSTLTLAICSSLSAAEITDEAAVEKKGLDFERIVITGAAGKGSTVMASSVSVSSLSADQIEVTTPRSSAENALVDKIKSLFHEKPRTMLVCFSHIFRKKSLIRFSTSGRIKMFSK